MLLHKLLKVILVSLGVLNIGLHRLDPGKKILSFLFLPLFKYLLFRIYLTLNIVDLLQNSFEIPVLKRFIVGFHLLYSSHTSLIFS
jgi:hypothetical protein